MIFLRSTLTVTVLIIGYVLWMPAHLAANPLGREPKFFQTGTVVEGIRDEYVPFDVYFNDEKEKYMRDHLSNFASSLIGKADQVGYVISYGGLSDVGCESVSNIKWIKSYLVGVKKIKRDRIVFVDGGYRKKGMTALYIIPKDAPPPAASPSYQINDISRMR